MECVSAVTSALKSALRSEIEHFVARLPLDEAPSASRLLAIAEALRRLAGSSHWRDGAFATARAGETRLYELAVSEADGPSLYLVSDGAGVSVPPHTHGVWAMIAGIRGTELNHLYALHTDKPRLVRRTGTVRVGSGDVLVMRAADIHATEVAGLEPSLHLHLYGRPLRRLAEFETRCYLPD